MFFARGSTFPLLRRAVVLLTLLLPAGCIGDAPPASTDAPESADDSAALALESPVRAYFRDSDDLTENITRILGETLRVIRAVGTGEETRGSANRTLQALARELLDMSHAWSSKEVPDSTLIRYHDDLHEASLGYSKATGLYGLCVEGRAEADCESAKRVSRESKLLLEDAAAERERFLRAENA